MIPAARRTKNQTAALTIIRIPATMGPTETPDPYDRAARRSSDVFRFGTAGMSSKGEIFAAGTVATP